MPLEVLLKKTESNFAARSRMRLASANQLVAISLSSYTDYHKVLNFHGSLILRILQIFNHSQIISTKIFYT